MVFMFNFPETEASNRIMALFECNRAVIKRGPTHMNKQESVFF